MDGLGEFAKELCRAIEAQHNYEAALVIRGEHLLHSAYLRLMLGVAHALQIGCDKPHARGAATTTSSITAPPPKSLSGGILQRYAIGVDVLDSLSLRRPFPESFVSLVREAFSNHTDDAEMEQFEQFYSRVVDNRTFTAEMDYQLLQCHRTHVMLLGPVSLRYRTVEVVSPRFAHEANPSRASHMEIAPNGLSASIPATWGDENTWVCARQEFTSGAKYWTVRCDLKPSALRYVGVGVGTTFSTFPAGSVRLLSDANIKMGSTPTRAEAGFGAGDVVGVLLDIDQGIVSFDVNGRLCGHVPLPDIAPGQGVRPLVYMFSPGDKVSGWKNKREIVEMVVMSE